ncbi:PLDc_N domain-containing protein [Pseudalkalibacillus caeni]|uniref:PLDc_N domain-containing protein n=2 Tax=Exobacillus caeni TaxID=2574798 RepID=A0A5R9F9V6_9BACL|nr:PLDc_N domain-containing protein [Pseudalkalibacillus caeni]
MIVALVDVIKSDDTNGPKWLWVLVILFIGFLGPILYFVIGRKR